MQTTRNKKSEKLTKEEMKDFKSFLAGFHTHVDAAEALGLGHSNMIRRVLNDGSAAPATVAKIRAKI